ncbi:MAG TPA: TIGR04211 family SH3 domain-containing protein [Gammaproteobacteria bacterium]|jgi:SH3 domain protein|nr:TIGR04211 family SH3 domain-containing protein [Gammaproteobacteria bacterium]
MKLQTNLVLFLIFLASSVNAETFVYITDQVDIPIRSEKSLGNTIIRLLPSGTKLSVLQITEDGWTEVKYQDTIGWISSRYLSNNISAREELKQANTVINENQLLITKHETELKELNKQLLLLNNKNKELVIKSSKSEAEKTHIEQIYQDALKLEHENEKLNQEQLQLKTELQLAQNNSQIERDTSQRNWFIVGALVLFFGIVIGFIMPKRLNRRTY